MLAVWHYVALTKQLFVCFFINLVVFSIISINHNIISYYQLPFYLCKLKRKQVTNAKINHNVKLSNNKTQL